MKIGEWQQSRTGRQSAAYGECERGGNVTRGSAQEFGEGSLTDRFRASLNHKNVGQTKFRKTELTKIRYKIK